jgi:hypothetical protein
VAVKAAWLPARMPQGDGAVAGPSTMPILTVEEPALSVSSKSGLKVPFGTISVTQFKWLEIGEFGNAY